ncbi:MAG: N-6 DNA methylase, partial [Prolixibacteraceae bacterium]|nr:N-6 DNA methylase [Prolixibacteraceae bacterium]
FHMADQKYNSGLFDFKEDKITPSLIIDNKILKTIVGELYYPNCEYEFSVMPADILGSVYERFLGKTIRLTKAHQAKIEEKPEVRKAGGVYYTPKYVVDYIVENTVGKMVEGKTPRQVAELAICDPACGSGSFLIGAYRFLLDWHLKYYAENPPKKKGEQPLTPDGKLTTAEKKRILLNNIYGVDIDAQAVEVTKLNLLLKALEGETQASVNQQLALFHERVLPNLNNNIKCGNSLIGTDFYDTQLELFPAQMKKVNAFDWEEAFPGIFKKGGLPDEASAKSGFDAVIGNPPYVNLVAIPDEQRNFLQLNYKTCRNKSDLYSFFLEKACHILKLKNGKSGFIVPHTWLATTSFELLRKKLLDEKRIEKIAEMGFKVFDGVTVSTVILICSHNNNSIKVCNKDFSTRFNIPTNKWIENNYHIDLEWNIVKEGLYKKIEKVSITLENMIKFSRGVKTSNDSRFIHREKKDTDYKPVFRGRNIKAYSLNWDGEYIWYRPDLMKEKVGCLPHTKKFFEVPEKLITQRVNSSMQLLVTYDNSQNYFLDTTNVSRYESWDGIHSMKFIAGVLNSKLVNYWYCNKYKMPTIGLYELHSIPIKKIDFTNNDEKRIHDQITQQVDKLLLLNKQLQEATLESQREPIKRAITHAEKCVDELVYQLYGLTGDEIKIVEGS